MLKPSSRRIFLWRSYNLVGLVGLLLVSCSYSSKSSTELKPQKMVNPMKLESDSFINDGLIPSKYTCDGQDISPPLSWDAPPTGTQSLALIVDDPDAPGGTYVHWVLYNLPGSIRHLPEAVAPQPSLPQGGIQGKNDFGHLGYGGPCPPSGTHRYFFKLYALSGELNLTSGATKKQLETAMDGHILAASEFLGRYSRQR